MPATAEHVAPHAMVARLNDQQLAVALIERGLRLMPLRSLFRRVPGAVLTRLYRDVRGTQASPGRIPTSFVGQIAAPADAAAAVVLLTEYLRAGGRRDVFDPSAMVLAWDNLRSLIGRATGVVSLDMTSMWLLLRDYRDYRVDIAVCDRCGTRRLVFSGNAPCPCQSESTP